MGACTFFDEAFGNSAKEAFQAAKLDAKWMHGHAGYTGTIAEKNSFSMASNESLAEIAAYKLAKSLITTDYCDKWELAGCIQIATSPNDSLNRYLFFGWASA